MKRYNKYISRIAMVKIHAENARKAGCLDFKAVREYLKKVAIIKNEALEDEILEDSEKYAIESIAERAAFEISELEEVRR